MKFLPLVILPFLFGCSTAKLRTHCGDTLDLNRFMQSVSFARVTVATNGTLVLEGYNSKGDTEFIKAMAAGMMEGMIKGGSKAIVPIP